MTDRSHHTASMRRAGELRRAMRRDRARTLDRDLRREYVRELRALRLDMQDTGRSFV